MTRPPPLPNDPFDLAIVAALPWMRRYALSWHRGDLSRAEDLVQETAMKALDHRAAFQMGTNIDAWLNRIMWNTFHNDRRKKREVQDFDGEITARHAASDDQHASLEAKQGLCEFEKLPDVWRVPMGLAADGLTGPDIALLVGTSEINARKRLYHGRKALREATGEG